MADDKSKFKPTHVLVLETEQPPFDLGNREIVDRTNAAFFTALDHADEVDVYINLEWCSDDLPAVADALLEAAEISNTTDEYSRLRSDPESVRNELQFLLDRTSHHRSYMLDQIDLRYEGEVIGRFDPEHDIFEIDIKDAPELADTVNEAIAETPARLVPGGILAEWTTDDRTVTLEPPYLAEEGWGLTDLRYLEAVAVDPDRQHLEFHWSDDHDGELRPNESIDAGGLLERLRATVFPPPRAPLESVTFESTDQFEDAVEGLQRLSEQFPFAVSGMSDQ